MAETTGISWAQSTFNIVWGCEEIPHDPCCTHCYARDFSKRLGMDLWGKTKPRKEMSEHYWNDPVRWNRKAEAEGRRHRVFCSSMADVFEDHPDLVAARERLWKVIAVTPALDWMLLTKRPENMNRFAPQEWASGWPSNVWAGTTVGTQEWAQKRCPILREVPARVRWLSVEPLFEALDLGPWMDWISWVIVGGESGRRGARIMEPEWVTSLIRQCGDHKVPFFFKQKGTVLSRRMGCKAEKGDDPAEWPEEFKIQEFPKVA
jgi:protein gp37